MYQKRTIATILTAFVLLATAAAFTLHATTFWIVGISAGEASPKGIRIGYSTNQFSTGVVDCGALGMAEDLTPSLSHSAVFVKYHKNVLYHCMVTATSEGGETASTHVSVGIFTGRGHDYY